jgi:hypothetical protein
VQGAWGFIVKSKGANPSQKSLVLMGKSLPERHLFHMDKREIGFPL